MRPEGEQGTLVLDEAERERALAVRTMFDAIAARYDFLNHFLSVNVDRSWRVKCVNEVRRLIDTPNPRILDVGCGTADLSLECSLVGPVVGCDFSHPMLQLGLAKAAKTDRVHPVCLVEGDALALPFRNAGFDAVVSAFVLRNLANLEEGLREMKRMLRPGGVLAVLDFALPDAPVLGRLYRVYFTRILPRLGDLISGVAGPYKYLPDSVATFPRPEELKGMVEKVGLGDVRCRLLTGGIAVLLAGRVRA